MRRGKLGGKSRDGSRLTKEGKEDSGEGSGWKAQDKPRWRREKKTREATSEGYRSELERTS